jgi:hypothetical protein
MSRTTVYDHARPYSPGWGDIHLINPGEVPQGNIRKEKINWEAFTGCLAWRIRYKDAVTGYWVQLDPVESWRIVRHLEVPSRVCFLVMFQFGMNPKWSSSWL